MCYIGNLNDDSSVAKLATEDITVWKCAISDDDNCILSPIRLYNYTPIKHHRVERLDVLLKRNNIQINAGFHSFTSLNFAKKSETLYDYRYKSYICYCKCYIPKGSIYFTNGIETVSQELVFVEAYAKKVPWYYKLLGIKFKSIYKWKE